MSRETHTGKIGGVSVWPRLPSVRFADSLEKDFQCNSDTEYWIGADNRVDQTSFIVWFLTFAMGDEDMTVVTDDNRYGAAVEVRLTPSKETP